MNNRILAIDAGSLYTPFERFAPGRIVVKNGTIAEAGDPLRIPVPAGADRIDASRFIATPGFIDPHIHGCGGMDVMDATYDALNTISRVLATHGTTSFLPTTVSASIDHLNNTVQRVGTLLSRTFDGALPMGIHLEGPFINTKRRGAHKEPHVAAPDARLLEKWIGLSAGTIRMITVAPELDGIDGIFEVARRAGVMVAMGHSEASFEEATRAASSGVCYAVHTFNAMREFAHRDPGIIGAVLSDDRIFAEIIADGIHVNPSVVRIFARAKGKARVLLVTDAISASGMPDGRYFLGADPVEVIAGVCRNSEGKLAGSTLSQEAALRNFVQWTSLPFEDALPGLTSNPAEALQLAGKGTLAPGADADITIMDERFNVVMTFVAGRRVFGRAEP